MAWVKIPKEHHPLFLEVVPAAPDVSTINMFGGLAATVNGHIAGGLFGRSMMVRLSPAHFQEALAIEGASIFDPMGNGRVMKDTAMLPEDVMERPAEMRRWLQRGVEYTRTLPPKAKTKPAAKNKRAAKNKPTEKAPAPTKNKKAPAAKKKKAVRARTR